MSSLKRRLHTRTDSLGGSSTSLIALGSPSSAVAQQLQQQPAGRQQRERGRTRQRGDLPAHNSGDGLPVQAAALVLTPTDSPSQQQQQQRGRRGQRESSSLLVEALMPGASGGGAAVASASAAAAPSEGSVSKQQHYAAAAAAGSDSEEFFRPIARARSFIEHALGISPGLWDRDRSVSREPAQYDHQQHQQQQQQQRQRPATASSVPAASSGIGSFFSTATSTTAASASAAALFSNSSISSSRQGATAAITDATGTTGAAVTPSASPPPSKASPFRAPPTSPQKRTELSLPSGAAAVNKCDAALLDIGATGNSSSSNSSSKSSPLVSALRLLCDAQAVAAVQVVCRGWRQHIAQHSLALLQEAAKLKVRGSASVTSSVRYTACNVSAVTVAFMLLELFLLVCCMRMLSLKQCCSHAYLRRSVVKYVRCHSLAFFALCTLLTILTATTHCCSCMLTHTYTYTEQGLALHVRPALYRTFVQTAAAVTAETAAKAKATATSSAATEGASSTTATLLLPAELDLQEYAELVAIGKQSTSGEMIGKDLPRAFGKLGQCIQLQCIHHIASLVLSGNVFQHTALWL
jgi:hypothetical protein